MNADNVLQTEMCWRCKRPCEWRKVDEIEEFDADGTRHCYVERQLDCAWCGEAYRTKRVEVDRPLRECMRDPAWLRGRTLIVGGGEVSASQLAEIAWGEQPDRRGT